MILEIYTPEGKVFGDEVSLITLPGVDGEFQTLENHAAIVSALEEGFVRFKGNFTLEEEQAKFFEHQQGEYRFKIKSGVFEMNANKAVVLAD